MRGSKRNVGEGSDIGGKKEGLIWRRRFMERKKKYEYGGQALEK